jgi:hypothetical protein
MKKIFPIIASIIIGMLCLLQVSDLHAGSSKRRGTSGAQELLIPVGSVGSALGGAFTANITGIEAAEWNPAGVADITGTGEAMISQMNYIADIKVSYAAVMAKMGGLGALGLTLKSVNFGDIAVTTTDDPDGTGEYYSPRYITIGAIYSRVMTDRIRFGAKLNLISEEILRTSARGVSLDAGVQYSTGPGGLRMGVVLRNFGPDMIFNGPDLEQQITPPGTEPGTRQEPWRVPLSSFELPTQMELGISYGIINTSLLKLTVGGSFLNDNFNFDQYRLGAELELMKMFYVRGSYAVAEDPDNNKFVSLSDDFMWGPGMGAGLKLNLGGNASLMFDYAYRPTKWFDNNQWFSVRFGF